MLALIILTVPTVDLDIATKKTDAVERLEAFHRVGLLASGPPGMAGLPFV
jgi:hypothetical protein